MANSLTLSALILGIIFLGALTHSTIGFGSALVQMPLLALVLDLTTATPLVALLSVVMIMMIAGDSWRSIDLKAVWRLIAGSVIGVPCGLFLLKSVPADIVTGLLGCLIIAFGVYNLARPTLPTLGSHHWAFGFGFLGGLLGGAYNTGGPPIVVYGALQRWSPTAFRGTIQGFFLPGSWLIAISHGLAGLWTKEVFQLFGLALLPMMVAIFLGSRLNRLIPPGRFDRLLYVILIVLGILLLT